MRYGALLLASLTLSCGGTTTPTISLTGTYIGSYTGSVQPGTVYQGVLQLTEGSNLTGTLTTNSGRSATFTGSRSNQRLTGTFTFTDACHGSATTTADLNATGTTLSGNYSASDCLGAYTGGYVLTKQ